MKKIIAVLAFLFVLAAGAFGQMDDPQSVSDYIIRGHTYLMQDDYNRAIADFTQAIRIDPNNELAYIAYSNRGYAYLQKGDYDIAIADCTQAIRLFPDFFISPYINRGFAYMYEGNYRQAYADAERALQIDPYNQRAQRLFAELQSRGY